MSSCKHFIFIFMFSVSIHPSLTGPGGIRSTTPIIKHPATTTTTSTTSTPTTTTTTTTTTTQSTTTSPRNCADANTVCLTGGEAQYMGNVLIGGSPVCDDSWDLADANVVCKELGYQKAKKALQNSRFGNVSSTFRMDNVKCRGTETRLVDCQHSTQDDCSIGESAGVECDTRDYSEIVNSNCFEMDISYNFGDSIDQTNSVNSTLNCQLYCQASLSCTHFSFYPDIPRCYRKTGNSKTFKGGAISGPRTCGNTTEAESPNVCFDYGVGYDYGQYLDYFTTEDENMCQLRCQNHAACLFFSYYKSSNECYMKTGSNSKRRHRDTISGPKYCPGDTNENNQTSAAAKCLGKDVLCLLGGGSDNEGNVYIAGKPVCDDAWDSKDGRVVCRELGYHGIVRVTKEGAFGKVPVQFAMDNVQCEGTEEKLSDCGFNADDDCGASEGAGVVCDDRSEEEINAEKAIMQECFDEGVTYTFGDFIDFEVSHSAMACQKHCLGHADCSHFSFYQDSGKCYRKTGNVKKSAEGAVSGPRNCSDPHYTANPNLSTTPSTCSSPGAICLSGGNSPSEGDITVGNRPVCDDDWTLVNAHVTCKQLGFLGALSFTKESRFGLTSANFIMDQVSCDGSEERLIDCNHSTSHDCERGESAGVICDTRTVDQENLLELSCFEPGVSYSPGNWIDYDIVSSPYDCQIHCLAHAECKFFTYYKDSHKCYRKTVKSPYPSMLAISGPRECLTGPQNTTKPVVVLPLKNCNSPGVACLKQGPSAEEGNVYVGGKPVCDDGWDSRDARVLCKELGFKDVLVTYVESHFGAVSERFGMDNVECTGSETSLGLCHHSTVDDCGRTEGAGVKCDNGSQTEIPQGCSAAGKICLIGGDSDNEGNVYFEGRPICDDGWTFADAHVVCTALGYQSTESATKESQFGIVPSEYGGTEVKCLGNEAQLSACNMTKFVPMVTSINCDRQEGAGVICSKELQGSESQDKVQSSSVIPAILVVLTVCLLAGLTWMYREKIGHVLSREIMVRVSGNRLI